MYATSGRPSVPPEQLLKATVLMAMYSIRSERAFCERLNYDLLFKWFLDLRDRREGVRRDDVLEEPSTAAGSRDRGPVLRRGGRARRSCAVTSRVITSPSTGRCWRRGRRTRASNPKTGRRRPPPPGRNAEVSFHGQRRSNQTHASTTDPEARMARKSNATAAKLSLCGASVDGAPQRAARRHRIDRSDRLRRTRHRPRDARPAPGDETATHRRRRQGLRHRRLRRRRPRARVHTPHRAEHDPPALHDRRAHHPPPRTSASVNGSANGSRNPSAGSRPSPVAANSATSADNATEPGSS